MRKTTKSSTVTPSLDPLTEPVSSGDAETIGQGERDLTSATRHYLIAARHGRLAEEAGVLPMSADELQTAIKSMPGVEVVKIIPGQDQVLPLTSADEAKDTYLVAMKAETAASLRSIAPRHLIIEEDQALVYGDKPHLAGAELSPLSVSGHTFQPQAVTIRVIDRNRQALHGVPVTLVDDSGTKQGVTDAQGRVVLPLLLAGSLRARSVEAKPRVGFWSCQVLQPDFALDRDNVMTLFSLDDPDSQEPPRSRLGWGQQLMGLADAGQRSTGRGVRIAIIDSGVDQQHPLLNHMQYGLDLTGGPADSGWSTDSIGHGSHCAGVIAARSDASDDTSGLQMQGFVPDAEIHVLKIFPGGANSSLVEALDYCIQHQIDLVNLSLGTPQINLIVEQKLQEVAEAGVACMVATGNSGSEALYPAASPYVLSVAALGKLQVLPPTAAERSWLVPGSQTSDGLFAPSFSCHGPAVDLCAPGVGIVSTVPGNGLYPDSGTSMATPHVTGLAGWLLGHPQIGPRLGARGPLRVARLYQLLRALCTPIPGSDPLNRFGCGVPQLQNLQRLYPSLFSSEQGVLS